MKKICSALMIIAVLMTGTAFADTPKAVLISAPIEQEVLKEGFKTVSGYVISYENQTLSIKVDGNEYPVTIYDKDDSFSEDLKEIRKGDFIEVVAEFGEATFYLNKINTISPVVEGAVPTLYGDNTKVPTLYDEVKVTDQVELIKFDVKAENIDGVMMIPLRSTLEKAGYKLEWNATTYSVDISKGNSWTSIKIGENAYFKNKMAPSPLSKEPIIIDGSTLVPAEFFNVILNLGVEVKKGNLIISEEEMTIHSGYVQEIQQDETGNMRITISSEEVSKEEMDKTIINVSRDNAQINTKVEKGSFVKVIALPIMTMSIPAQISGVIIY